MIEDEDEVVVDVLPQGTEVDTDWFAYYDLCWQARGRVFERILAEGETSLARVLARFKRFGETHSTMVPIVDRRRYRGTILFKRSPSNPSPLEKLADRPGVIRGSVVHMPAYMNLNLTQMVLDFAREADVVAELGAGYGSQLFSVHLAGAPAGLRYVSCEPSPAGRDLSLRLAALEPGMRFEARDFRFEARDFRFDAPDLSFLADAPRALVFTAWSIMYVQAFPHAFFTELAKLPGEVTCVFFEPLGFQVLPSDSHSLQQEGSMRAVEHQLTECRHNRDFHQVAMAAVEEGLVDLEFLSPHLFSNEPNMLQMGSLWVFRKPAGER